MTVFSHASRVHGTLGTRRWRRGDPIVSSTAVTTSCSRFPSSSAGGPSSASPEDADDTSSMVGSSRNPGHTPPYSAPQSLRFYLDEVRCSPAYLRHGPPSHYYTLASSMMANPDLPSSMADNTPFSFSTMLRAPSHRHRILLLDEFTAKEMPLVSSEEGAESKRNAGDVTSEEMPLPFTRGVYLLSTTSVEDLHFSAPSPFTSRNGPKKEGGNTAHAGRGEGQAASPFSPVSSILIGLPEVQGEEELQRFIHTHRSLLSTVRVVCLPEITLSTRRVLQTLFQQCFLPSRSREKPAPSSAPSSERTEDDSGMEAIQVWCSAFGKAMLLDDHFYTTVLHSVLEEEKAKEERYSRPLSARSQASSAPLSSWASTYQWLIVPSKEDLTATSTAGATEKDKTEGQPADVDKEVFVSFRIPTKAIHVVPEEGCTFEGYRNTSREDQNPQALPPVSPAWSRPLQAIQVKETASSNASSSSSLRPAHYRNIPIFFYDPVFQAVFVGNSILRTPWLSQVMSHIATTHAADDEEDMLEEEKKGSGKDFLQRFRKEKHASGRGKEGSIPRMQSVRFAASFPACQRCYPMPLFTHLEDERRGRRGGGGGKERAPPAGRAGGSDGKPKQEEEEGATSAFPAGPAAEVLGVRSCWQVHSFTDALCQGMRRFPLDPPTTEEDTPASDIFLPPQRVLSAQYGEIPGDVEQVVGSLQESAKELERMQQIWRAVSSPSSSQRVEILEEDKRRATLLPTALVLLWTTNVSARTVPERWETKKSHDLWSFPWGLSTVQQRCWFPFLEWCFPFYHPRSSLQDGSTTEKPCNTGMGKGVRGMASAWGRMCECLWFSAQHLPASSLISKTAAENQKNTNAMEEQRGRRHEAGREGKGSRGELTAWTGEDDRRAPTPSSSRRTSLPSEMCGKPGIALLNSILTQKHLSGLCRVVSKEEIDVEVFLSMTPEEIQKVFKPTFGLRKRIEGLQEEVKKKVEEVLQSHTSEGSNTTVEKEQTPSSDGTVADRRGPSPRRGRGGGRDFYAAREHGGPSSSGPRSYPTSPRHTDRQAQNVYSKGDPSREREGKGLPQKNFSSGGSSTLPDLSITSI